MRNRTCDVLVVGAGPAGAMAASATSNAGYKTILVERKAVVGLPVKCAEYIPVQLVGEVSLRKNCIAQNVVGMKTFIGGKIDDTNNAKGYMIHRNIFDQTLVDRAIATGTFFMNNSDFTGLNSTGAAVIKNREDGSLFNINAKIVIGADGPNSRVAAATGFSSGCSIPGIQYTLPLLKPEEYTEVHFNKEIFGGYGWFFPKNDLVNIGIGMERKGGSQASLKTILENFIQGFIERNRVVDKITGSACGWIPVSPRESCVKDNVLLAGDAAGHTHPITGAGIFAAVMCGKMAGNATINALRQQNMALLNDYDSDWQSLFGKTLTRASHKRAFMVQNWDDFESTVKQTWVAYKPYYRNDA